MTDTLQPFPLQVLVFAAKTVIFEPEIFDESKANALNEIKQKPIKKDVISFFINPPLVIIINNLIIAQRIWFVPQKEM